MQKNLSSIQDLLRDNGILISFSGRFSQGIIEELGDALKKHLEVEATPKNEIHSVFSVFIEQTQNIKNYSSRKLDSIIYDKVASSGIVSIGKCEKGYFIWSGNLIENSDVEPLKEKLELISNLDKTGLKKLYKERLRMDHSACSIGAGVGLIDIARKASSPIEYSIQEVDYEFSFFELRVIV
jgi:hypothetical protein